MLTVLAFTLLLAVPPAPPPHPATQATAAPSATIWKIDPVHSEINFRIRHLVGRVSGTFNVWSGTIVGTPPDWNDGKVDMQIMVASIDTRIARRDDHLRSAAFFDAERYPEIAFHSTKVVVNGNDLRIFGDLTLHGVTRPVVFAGKYWGETTTLAGRRVGFHAEGSIDRRKFGITWNQALEDGGVTLGEEVEIELNIEATPVQQ